MGNSFDHICKYALCIVLVLVCNLSRAQDYYNFTQVDAYAGYSWIADTYSHSAYTAGISADYHFHKTFYASVTGRITNYKGRKMDRIFACIYVGYGKVSKDYEEMSNDGYAESFDSRKAGVGCILQLGYEHCFGGGFVMGASLDGQYLAGNFSWTAGLRLGFRF